ncbi:hypothetical protein BJ322DRAFT_1034996 [Thelephora terrestris]|uniref:RMT2 domain-containing protein n=1 Tax=Thelephora terrestris TaxID=56493 RepID=A0A9P6HVD5_9AGAM|nr:hypothetical protein BJ322DRAFT_1034996 [Thelephora terrestris]
MATDEDLKALSMLGGYLIFSILQRRPSSKILTLIDAGAPLWYQDGEGTSPLHAAAYIEDEELVRVLIEKGALWNAVDNLHNTAADIALSMNNEGCYRMIRDAGIRSELLLNLIASKPSFPASIFLRAEDDTATGSTEAFLSSKLHYTRDKQGQEICLLREGDKEVGVMMGWERDIMRETVKLLCADHPRLNDGLKILNVGFGLGIIDSFFQELSTSPALHVIIEPHQDVLEYMKSQGWYSKPNVKILEGKWQDYIDSPELLAVGKFDVVYTDTFSEEYKELHQFFKRLPALVDGPESRFSFFNGLGATNVLFYDVYTNLAELQLNDLGLDVTWKQLSVAQKVTEDRWGGSLQYFALPFYQLPVGRMRVAQIP